ncbi:MAG: CoA transferase [Pseudomonadota bacterium]
MIIARMLSDIDVAQTDVLTSMNIIGIAETLARKKHQSVRPYNMRGASLCYNTYRTRDGKHMALGALEEKFWINFCRTVGKEEWIPLHLSPYRDGEAATEAFKLLFAERTQQEWVDLFEGVDTCLTPILMPEGTLEDAHLRARRTITEMEDPERDESLQLGFPARFSEELDYRRSPAPFLGQHTREILSELGYTSFLIQKLEEDGVI